ncbi:MAG: alpha amylase N-terminal ig-like domain-containing protein [Fimbriimonadaceae bacterium]|nr:alpha amylase N-terminal ig-like domain-containing protein [Fimbriimonadaceae bacterium]QYK55579.1 MAG: alpha amylase N-terminal ig-like domain-containing protein [Fimbriimonadaceae bacterium]
MSSLLLAAALALLGEPHTFTYVPDRPASRVNLAGTFNNWNKDATSMTLGADGKTWTAKLDLPLGKHYYKFVLDGDTWVTDPKAPSESDASGYVNSVLYLFPPDYGTPAVRGDGTIAASALAHRQEMPSLNWDRGKLLLTLRARPHDLVKVFCIAGDRKVPMTDAGGDDFYTYYQAAMPWSMEGDIDYCFRIEDGPTVRYFGPDGLSDKPETFKLEHKTFKPFQPPSWVEKAVFYQIFPERFANGDKSNDPPNVQPWDAEPRYDNWMGGDLAGVRQNMGHIVSLGVDAVYFNPIFEGPSNHHYETTDYLKVDHRFGTNEEFRDLVQELKAAGVRTVLDGVFNHTSIDFFAFKDLLQNQEKSKYAHWYFVKSFPVIAQDKPSYEAWWGFPSMPKLNLLQPEVSRYVLTVPDYWNDFAKIDGWRLDVANEVPMEFWRQFRTAVKTKNPEAWIVGEEWGDASGWLKGDQWDASMNYPFRGAVLGFVAQKQLKPSDFWKRLNALYDSYGPQVSRNMLNLLGSHDTPRLLHECGGDGRLARLAAMIQFTWVGAPSVYYGDELGMEGGADPQNRRGMRWDLATPDNPYLSLYRKLGKIRRETPALQSGDPSLLEANDEEAWLAFARTYGDERAVVVVNRGESPARVKLDLPESLMSAGFYDLLNERAAAIEGGALRLEVPALSVAILVPGDGSLARAAAAAPRPVSKHATLAERSSARPPSYQR